MTKAEERKVLEQVRNLISGTELVKKAFEGVLELAEENISCDFWLSFPDKLECERKENAEHGKRLLEVEHERDVLRQAVENKDAEIATLNHLLDSTQKNADEWEQNAHDAGDLYCELEKECSQKILEIRNLKAEIVRMKLERMTDVEYAELYEKMEGAK